MVPKPRFVKINNLRKSYLFECRALGGNIIKFGPQNAQQETVGTNFV